MHFDAIWESSVPCSQEAGPYWGCSAFYCFCWSKWLAVFIQLDACLQGVKFALNSAQVPAVSKLDHDTLHLVWTEERLQQQLDVLDRRWEMLVYFAIWIYDLHVAVECFNFRKDILAYVALSILLTRTAHSSIWHFFGQFYTYKCNTRLFISGCRTWSI